MLIIRNKPDFGLNPSVAAIGFFDGVHLGHRYLIDQVKKLAVEKNLHSQLITFPVHPRKVLDTTYMPRLLTTCDEKIDLLSQTGIDYCSLLDFTAQISHLSAWEFMRDVLLNTFHVKCLVIGYDHRFGFNRNESFDDYVKYGLKLGIDVVLAAPYIMNNDTYVSSSVIRSCLSQGDVVKASLLLGYDYFINGKVIGGFKVGRTIGFPTANIRVDDPDKLIPADGVYAVCVGLKGNIYKGMMNIGHRPTMDNGDNRSVEVHILDFHESIYDCPIHITFKQYIRPEIKFSDVGELIKQLESDAVSVRMLL